MRFPPKKEVNSVPPILLVMFSFVVKAMSIRVCDLSVTLVGSLTNCVKLRVEQKLDKARPSEQFPCRLQFRSPIIITFDNFHAR